MGRQATGNILLKFEAAAAVVSTAFFQECKNKMLRFELMVIFIVYVSIISVCNEPLWFIFLGNLNTRNV